MILTLGWIAAVAFFGACCSSARHGWRDKARGPWIGAGLYACAAFVMLAVDGVLKPLSAGVLAGLALAAAGAVAWIDGRKDAPRKALGYAGAGFGHFGRDLRGLWRWFMAWIRGLFGAGEEPAETEAVVAEHVATRNIPPVMSDPVLGAAPEPAALATAAPVPPPYAALAAYIGGFEPEDDQALKMFMQGNAAGECAVADAWHAFAETCLSGVGLDPAFVAGLLEAGDSAAQHASLLAMVHKRFGVVYAAVQEWISAGRRLPHKARDFLTGEAA